MSFLVVHVTSCWILVRERPEKIKQSTEAGRAAQTAARRKLTTNMPDCGRWAPDRLLSSLAMWPRWAGVHFFHSAFLP